MVNACQRCGQQFTNPEARFCSECGHDNSWSPAEIDRPELVIRYATVIHNLYFDPENTPEMLHAVTLQLRDKQKISFVRHESIVATFQRQKNTIAEMMRLRIEFNENVLDAFAGHDTYLKFRVSNGASGMNMFKLNLEWSDPDQPDIKRFQAVSPSFLKPGQQQEIAGTHVFLRAGPKEMTDMWLTVENQFMERFRFRLRPFSFRIGTTQQTVVNNISTHNQISIEGRGVVDASGAASGISEASHDLHPRWKSLVFEPVLDLSLLDLSQEQSSPSKARVGPQDFTASVSGSNTVDHVKQEKPSDEIFYSSAFKIPKWGEL